MSSTFSRFLQRPLGKHDGSTAPSTTKTPATATTSSVSAATFSRPQGRTLWPYGGGKTTVNRSPRASSTSVPGSANKPVAATPTSGNAESSSSGDHQHPAPAQSRRARRNAPIIRERQSYTHGRNSSYETGPDGELYIIRGGRSYTDRRGLEYVTGPDHLSIIREGRSYTDRRGLEYVTGPDHLSIIREGQSYTNRGDLEYVTGPDHLSIIREGQSYTNRGDLEYVTGPERGPEIIRAGQSYTTAPGSYFNSAHCPQCRGRNSGRGVAFRTPGYEYPARETGVRPEWLWGSGG